MIFGTFEEFGRNEGLYASFFVGLCLLRVGKSGRGSVSKYLKGTAYSGFATTMRQIAILVVANH